MFKSIFFRTLVAVTIVLLIKIALNFSPEISVPGYEKKVHVSELIEVSDVTVLFTGAFFVIGIFLAATMAVYKESINLPGEIASNLEALEDHMLLAIRTYKPNEGKEIKADQLYASLVNLTSAIVQWFHSQDKDSKTIFSSIRNVNEVVYYLAKIGGEKEAVKGMQDNLNQLRKNITRTYYIARTEFLAPAFLLLLSIVGCVILMLLMCKFKTPMAGYIVIGLVSFIFVYLIQLIKGLDNPFDYGVDAMNVDLLPINRFKERLDAGFHDEVQI